jgi:hypothetical protein
MLGDVADAFGVDVDAAVVVERLEIAGSVSHRSNI